MDFPQWLTARPIAHRGLHDGNKAVWENSPSAFERAARTGYAIECDVHMSADGVPVVFHDDELDRLTGTSGFIHEKTAQQMGQLCIGGTADHVPTLAETLAQVSGRVPLVIELKGIEGKDAGLVAAVGTLLAAYDGPAAIMSFDHWLVRRFRQDAPGIPGGLTAMGISSRELEAHFSMLAHDIAFASFHVETLDNPFVRFMRRTLNRPVISWTVRTPEQVALTRTHGDQMTFEGFDPDGQAFS